MSGYIKPRTGMHLEILAMMQDGPIAPRQVAFRTGWPLHAVCSSMRAMKRRNEIVMLKREAGKLTRYRVKV